MKTLKIGLIAALAATSLVAFAKTDTKAKPGAKAPTATVKTVKTAAKKGAKVTGKKATKKTAKKTATKKSAKMAPKAK